MSNQFIGRRVNVGLGIEATPGTSVAPTDWTRQMSLDFQRTTGTIQNESALGRIEKVNDSAVVSEWAEGKLEGKVWEITFGYLLYNMFGAVATTTNADASGTVKDHTFTVGQSNTAPTLTVVRKDPVSNRRHALGTLQDLEISGEAGDWVKYSSTLKALSGTTGSDTVSLTTEHDFTSKHVTLKLATSTGGLGAASAIAVKSFKLKMERSLDPYVPVGAIDPTTFNTGSWEASGEFVLQYLDGTYETDWFANTIKAMSLTLNNTDVTIGTSAHPQLVFTAPQVRLNTFSMSNDLDKVVEQTVGFYCEFSTGSSSALSAVLSNLKTLYA